MTEDRNSITLLDHSLLYLDIINRVSLFESSFFGNETNDNEKPLSVCIDVNLTVMFFDMRFRCFFMNARYLILQIKGIVTLV